MRRDHQHRSPRPLPALAALLAAIVLGACSSASTSAPSAAGAVSSPAASAAASQAPASAAASAAAVAVVSPPAIQTAGKIVFCSDISSPPIEYMDANNQPTGSDVLLGDAIAAQLGLQPVWSNIPFDGLIPALEANHCDAIMSQLFDKPARRQVINLVDYMNSSEAILVAAGNPKHIQSLNDLSGDKVAVEDGTTIQSLLTAQNDTFKTANKPPITIVVFPRDTDALQQLQIGQVDAYGTTLESAAYYIAKSPNTFEVAGQPFNQILTGIGVAKDNTALTQAIQTAFDAVKANGAYLKILTQFGIQGDALP
jgi:polar amino acid transport system substrate-binding protein